MEMRLIAILSSDEFNKAADLYKEDFTQLKNKINKAGADIRHLKELESGEIKLTMDDKESAISRKGMTYEDLLVERCEQLDAEIKEDIKACVEAVVKMNNNYSTLTGKSFIDFEDADKQLTYEFEQFYIAS